MKVNLAQLNIGQAVEIELFVRAFQEGEDLHVMRSHLGESAIVKRLGNNVFGYRLSEKESNELGFAKKHQPIATVDARFINNLLRKAIAEKATNMGLRQAESDKYEKNKIAFALGDDMESVVKQVVIPSLFTT